MTSTTNFVKTLKNNKLKINPSLQVKKEISCRIYRISYMRTCWLAAITRSFCGLVSRSMNTRRALSTRRCLRATMRRRWSERSTLISEACICILSARPILPQCGCDGCGRRFPENTCKERADHSGKLPEVSVYPAVCGEGTADSGAAYVGEGRKTWNGTMENTAAAGRIQR